MIQITCKVLPGQQTPFPSAKIGYAVHPSATSYEINGRIVMFIICMVLQNLPSCRLPEPYADLQLE